MAKVKVPTPPSELEELLALHLRADKLTGGMVREHRPHDVRKWRFDFAWPDKKLAVECEGGVFSGGRHTRGSGFVRDAEKYNWATANGWRVLRYVESEIRNGNAVAQIQRVLAEVSRGT